MMVVFSLPDSIFFAWPRSFSVHVLQLQAQFLADHRAAGQDRHVFQHRLAAVAEARRLDGHRLEDAADVVHHQGRERLAFDFLGDDQQRLARLGHLLQQRQQLADRADLLVVQQDVRIVQHRDLLLRVVDEVGREVAAVELHAFDDVELVLQALAVFHGDHAFLADLVHRVGDDLADVRVGVRRDRADLGDFLGGLAGLRDLLQLVDHGDHRLVDAALQVHRVHAGGDVLHAFADDGLRQHGGGGGAVTGDVGGLGSDFLHHLRAHVLELVLQFDFLGDRDTVLGDGGGAERALEHHVAALGAERDFDGVGQDVQSMDHLDARVLVETYLFGWHSNFSCVLVSCLSASSGLRCRACGSVAFDHAHDVFLAHDEEFIALHLHGLAGILAEQHLVAGLDVERDQLAVVVLLALADGDDFALVGFLGRGVGITMPPAVLRSSSMRLTMTRSCNGRIFIRVSNIIR